MARRPQRAPHRPQNAFPRRPQTRATTWRPTTMKHRDELTRRRQRAFNCAIFQADLHATPSEHGEILRLKRLVRADAIPLTDATRLVNQLRQDQQTRAA
jgi:hypothetical protein